jgi:hypothetical protein
LVFVADCALETLSPTSLTLDAVVLAFVPVRVCLEA